MSTTSPPPDSTPTAVPPTSTSSPPPPVSPTIQPNATSPDSSPPPPVQTPPPQSPPPAIPSAPPPSIVSSPPPTVNSPPPATPPSPSVVSSPPPTSSTPPPPADPPKSSPSPPPPSDPPVSSSPPPVSSPPPPASTSPVGSPPPPTSTPPKSSPPPPTTKPPESSPPPPSVDPPANSPPPPTPTPPQSSPSPPKSQPPQSSPPPPSVDPPTNSPPPPTSTPPKSSPSPPKSQPPQSSQPPPPQEPDAPISSPPPPGANPPKNSPPLPTSPPPSNSTEITSPPPPPIEGQPPTSVLSPPSSPSPPLPSEASLPATGSGISTGTVVAISAALGLIVLSLIGLLVWRIVRRKRKASGYNAGYIMPSPYGSSPNSGSSFLQAHSSAPLVGSDSVPSPGLGNSRPWFTYEELFDATNGFSEQNLLGEGGFGCVYKGCLPDGREVAVKQLKIGGGQGEREFKAEVEIISRIHHRHLVSLVGYCISDSRRLLIYEFVPNDTLYFHLHGKDRPVMDWAMRVRVAAGAARGIAYLHEDCHPRIIHRDIKSSNILLGANFEARVSDFGLAKLAADADTHITTRIMGTFGYMAPEYAASGKLTDKSDVYSFGVVLLEMITGRKPVDVSQPLGDESLVEWARPLLSDALETGQFDRIADPRLEKNYVESEMFRMVEAAAACVRHSAAKRPRMSQVVRALDSLAASDLLNGMKPGQSEVYDSEQQSAEIRLFQRMAFGSQNYSTDFFSQSSMLNK